jgi:hypothetical protein
MTRWTIPEFIAEMKMDNLRRVLFVEGRRDLAFWKDMAPILHRSDTVIYPVSILEVEENFGGERGRLIKAAKEMAGTELSDRILFFTDADFDRFIEQLNVKQIVYTDTRDLETYALNSECISNLCSAGLALDEVDYDDLMSKLKSIGQTLHAIRLVSCRDDLRLPVNATLKDKGLKKFIDTDTMEFGTDKFVNTLIERSDHSLAIKSDFLTKSSEILGSFDKYDFDQTVHGKDFILALAFLLNKSCEVVEPLIFMAISNCSDQVRSRPNIKAVLSWIEATQ